ncbi:MAG: SIMPL domain-containing protein [Anaerolineae bacterium]|nr:SIMPL domain-containing protein [Candidatus Roseilinea sp.]MDW8448839.1 SIMPL domain-containing protein [Anaerolineae bacterium]
MTKGLLTTLVAGTLAAAILAVRPAHANTTLQQNNQPFRRTVTVIGVGRATASPDIARVTLGVDIVNPRLSAALTEANRKMAAIMTALEKAGVEKKDIQTAEFNVFPQQSYGPSGPGPITGYRVINTVRVTVRDLDNAGAVLDAAINAGANTIQGLVFTIENVKAIEADARKGAMADAKAKAEALAGEAGAKVGRVLTISEIVSSGGPLPVIAAAPAAEGLGGGVSITPGTQDVTVQVQVSYEIE